MASKLIRPHRGVSVAVNFESLSLFRNVVESTNDVPGVVGYTIGGAFDITRLAEARKIIEAYDGSKTVIYDPHKAADYRPRARQNLPCRLPPMPERMRLFCLPIEIWKISAIL